MIETTWINKSDNYNSEYMVVVYEKGIHIGLGILEVDNGVFTIKNITVFKEYRLNGYGDLMLRMLVRKAFNIGANCIFAKVNITKEVFFKKLDFKVIEVVDDNINMICTNDVKGRCR